MSQYRLLAISGSLRKGSVNTSLINAFIAHAPEGISIEMLDWSDTPIFNQDDEVSFPAYVHGLKEKIEAADGVIISTPEYNRSIPGPLKNVLDWTSRPWGKTSWNGKPVYIIGATPGAVGTALAQDDIKKFMAFNSAFVMGQPEFYMTDAPAKFDGNGMLTHADTREHILKGLTAFSAFIERLRK